MTASAPTPVVHRIADLRAQVAAWRAEGLRVALVPTMGALHQGHLTLVRHAFTRADRVVVSVFVNPIQFGPNEDFDAYPRTLEADRAALATVGASLVFAPAAAEMYPQGFATAVTVAGVSEGLCGGSRPGHFSGVATVVTKLLLQALPDVACFGEKDYQQLQVIRRFVADLDIPVEIVGVPTVREDDGLARSSRNAYLTAEQRAVAPTLHRTLQDTAQAIRSGAAVDAALEAGRRALLAAGFASVDYLELRAAEGLAPLAALDRPARLLVAARLGNTRLIDNIPVQGA